MSVAPGYSRTPPPRTVGQPARVGVVAVLGDWRRRRPVAIPRKRRDAELWDVCSNLEGAVGRLVDRAVSSDRAYAADKARTAQDIATCLDYLTLLAEECGLLPEG